MRTSRALIACGLVALFAPLSFLLSKNIVAGSKATATADRDDRIVRIVGDRFNNPSSAFLADVREIDATQREDGRIGILATADLLSLHWDISGCWHVSAILEGEPSAVVHDQTFPTFALPAGKSLETPLIATLPQLPAGEYLIQVGITGVGTPNVEGWNAIGTTYVSIR